MKIVIDIPDQKYKWIIENPQTYTDELHDAIRNGTPLPKGHGRLIDADKLQRVDHIILESAIDNAPTIIEADTSEDDRCHKIETETEGYQHQVSDFDKGVEADDE